MGSRRAGKRPQARGDERLPNASRAGSPDGTGNETPYFCLNCQRPGYTIGELDQEGQAALIKAMHNRRAMTWNELMRTGKGGLGPEWLPARMLPSNVPAAFTDRERFLAFRYRDRLKMVGARVDNVFHVLWIERHYGELYDHGGS